MFTRKAQTIVDLAKDITCAAGGEALQAPSILVALVRDIQGLALLCSCTGLSADKIRTQAPVYPEPMPHPDKMSLSAGVKTLLRAALDLAQKVPEAADPGKVGVGHLVCAWAMDSEIAALLGVAPLGEGDASKKLEEWRDEAGNAPRLDDLTDRLRKPRPRPTPGQGLRHSPTRSRAGSSSGDP